MIFPAQTSRLVLRAWREDDFDAFAAMNADPRVMEYFPAPLTREESAAFFGHIREEFQTEGFGLYAVERISDGSQLGYTGLHRVDRKSTRLNSSHRSQSRMPSSA